MHKNINHLLSNDYHKLYDKLSPKIQKLSDKSFKLLNQSERHPSLCFKKLREKLWSIRIGIHYRALGTPKENGRDMVWFWVGHHSQYDKLIK